MLEAARASKLMELKVLLQAGRSSRPAGTVIKSPCQGDAPPINEYYLAEYILLVQ